MPRECTVWIAAHHKEKRALEILAREIAPAGTGMGEGISLIATSLHGLTSPSLAAKFCHRLFELYVVCQSANILML